jgi:hypothetical protein
VRFAPPLVITEEDLKESVKIIGECLLDFDQVSCPFLFFFQVFIFKFVFSCSWMKSQVTRSEGSQAHSFFNFFCVFFAFSICWAKSRLSNHVLLLPVIDVYVFLPCIWSYFLSLFYYRLVALYIMRIPFFCVYMMFFFDWIDIQLSLSFLTLDVHYSFATSCLYCCYLSVNL